MVEFKLSFGALGDVLWRNVPEVREEIAKIVCETVEFDAEHDGIDVILPQIQLCESFGRLVVIPALDRMDVEALKPAMRTITMILRLGNVPFGVYADALFHGVIQTIRQHPNWGLMHVADAEAYNYLMESYGFKS